MKNDSRAKISRRDFITCTAGLVAAGTVAATVAGGSVFAADDKLHKADFWEKAEKGHVRCTLCPHRCSIADGRRGVCRVRENRGGTLYTLSWGRPCALHADPIEKKPFYHFLPGSISLSMSTVGCNMKCLFCQNWQISQSSPEDIETEIVNPGFYAKKAISSGASSIAFTYGEPVVFLEYARDIAEAAKASGIRSVVVSNGYIEPEPLAVLCSTVDAIKIDLKAFEDGYYRKICGARLDPVLRSLVDIRSRGVWLEIVYLMVPTLNDDAETISRMASWIGSELGPDVPVHFSRFHPAYRLPDLPPTPTSSLEEARDRCLDAGLNYVYIGNVAGHEADSTYCFSCSEMIIERSGYRISSIEMNGNKCGFCGTVQPGIWRNDS
jgi:pyruvate formate lyase activating enzyme